MEKKTQTENQQSIDRIIDITLFDKVEGLNSCLWLNLYSYFFMLNLAFFSKFASYQKNCFSIFKLDRLLLPQSANAGSRSGTYTLSFYLNESTNAYLSIHSAVKSDNLQYNMLDHWLIGLIDLASDGPSII